MHTHPVVYHSAPQAEMKVCVHRNAGRHMFAVALRVITFNCTQAQYLSTSDWVNSLASPHHGIRNNKKELLSLL